MTAATAPRYTVSQRFYFDAAHTLRREVEAAGSARVHGHTYHAEVFFTGTPHPESGMVVDLGHVRQHLHQVRAQLDHHNLDTLPSLGVPTLENLCRFIAGQFAGFNPAISSVRVWRDGTADACLLTL